MKIGLFDTKKYVVTDFETFYDPKNDYTLAKMRYEEYILDKRFSLHGIGVAYPSGKTDFIEPKSIKSWLKSYRTHSIVNHNLFFDGLIWKLRFDHVAPFLVDTLGLANSIFGPAEVSGGNNLEAVAERLGFQPKGKVAMFEGLKVLSPMEKVAMATYATNDADLTNKTLHALLPQLSRPEFELWLLDHTLRIYLTKPLPVNAHKCVDGSLAVRRNIHAQIKALPKISFRCEEQVGSGKSKRIVVTTKVVDESVLASNKQFGQALRQTLKKAKVPTPEKQGKNGPIPALAKGDEGFIALRTCGNKTVAALVSARLAKRSGDTQVARLRTLQLCARLGGFRVYLNYWGAGTGRWSGGSGLNAHNFPNPTRSTDAFEREVATLIRSCITAGKGRVFTAVDAANIEARVLAWWAGQQDLVDAFGSGTDVYSTFASEAFGEEVRKPLPSDEKSKAIRFKLLRNVGKATVLGLGYSMGNTPQPGKEHGKFESNLRSAPDVKALFDSGDLSTEKCNELLKKYRSTYTNIVGLWTKVENAFHKAREGGSRLVNGVLFSRGKGRDVLVTLPSGRVIHYPNARAGDGHGKFGGVQWVYGHGKGKKLYGGLLVENIVQAISRDILAEGVWSMEKAGWPVSYHVHDAIVCAPLKKDAKKCMEYCIEVLSAAPEWGPGMRLGAEGAIEECFA